MRYPEQQRDRNDHVSHFVGKTLALSLAGKTDWFEGIVTTFKALFSESFKVL